MEGPIVEEVRKVREEHAARFNYDVDAIFEDLKKIEKGVDGQLSPLSLSVFLMAAPNADSRSRPGNIEGGWPLAGGRVHLGLCFGTYL
jgi:hypothetical protein